MTLQRKIYFLLFFTVSVPFTQSFYSWKVYLKENHSCVLKRRLLDAVGTQVSQTKLLKEISVETSLLCNCIMNFRLVLFLKMGAILHS